MREVILKKSTNSDKKHDAYVEGKKVSFGAKGYSDFTQHKDEERKRLYIARHQKEDWSKSNIQSPAFWARWLLWEKTTLSEAIKNIENKFDVKIKFMK